jgi:hypothetical protein
MRTAISFDRDVARDKSRLAILTHAIKSKRLTAQNSMSSGVFTSPTISCCSDLMLGCQPLSAGN